MVYVCDAIMGAGKTQAVIKYMNKNSLNKYIFITPFLGETERIRSLCPSLNFAKPNNNIKQYQYSKLNHTSQLITDGRNIVSTHAAFKLYTEDMLDKIRSKNYWLIIDESIDTLVKSGLRSDDIEIAEAAGYLERNGDELCLRSKSEKYTGTLYRDTFSIMKNRNLIKISDLNDELYYWELPPEFIMAFCNVFILTYMFEAQSIHHMLKINNIKYTKIGVVEADGEYMFSDDTGYDPPYVSNLANMIHIYDNDKLNRVGDPYYSLSMNWFSKPSNKNGVVQLKNNIGNYFRNIMSDHKSERRMYGTYSDRESVLKGKGYSLGFVVFNSRATNIYKNRDTLAYCVNLFTDDALKHYYSSHGININDNDYALSTMVQWIWRSSIRDGNEIWLYVPSSRMRSLLNSWIESFNNK